MKFLTKVKYGILKVIDLTGLTFLAPIVRLCSGEEPRQQLKKIGQWIVIPVLGVLLAVVVYNSYALKVKTKSGTLPQTSKIYSSFKSINTLHDREKLKESAYELEGEARQQRIKEVKYRLNGMETKIKDLKKALDDQYEKQKKELNVIVKPVADKLEMVSKKIKNFGLKRKNEEKEMAAALVLGEKANYEALLVYMHETKVKTKEMREEKNNLSKKLGNLQREEFPEYAAAKVAHTDAVETKAFYESYLKNLTTANRSFIVAQKREKIGELREEFYVMTGASAYSKASAIVREEISIKKKLESSYPAAKTIWYQVQRSILCVFAGFFIGSLIAIPVGILCGLNKTFMAAMTPFIAVFKPVSPIVWLPIVLIVVNSYFPDPDTHPVLVFMAELPLIGPFKFNPAFIASAVTVALCSLWATMANTALGVASIDKDHMNVARVLKLGFFARLFKIVIPSSLPLIFAGLRISLGVGWMVLIAAELLSTSEGIGKFVIDEFNNGASDSLAKMIVVVFIVGIIGLFLDRIMVVFQRMVSFEGSAATV